MTDAKHTPGPWKFVRDSEFDMQYLVTHDGVWEDPDGHGHELTSGDFIAYSRFGSPHIPTEVQDANARLIAMAPEMLAALVGARKALRKALEALDDPDGLEAYLGEWLDEINEVLDKHVEREEK